MRTMNHKVLAIAPILAVAALVLTAVGFAIPQQAFAGYGHHHNHHNHHNNSGIDVSQTINQLNNCTAAACENVADNQADIHR
jgi:hypothetical protein